MEPFDKFYEEFTAGKLVPLNFRRKLLIERQYVYPSSGDKAVMDLYALYTLWWDMGAGKEAAGYEQLNIRNHKRAERVNAFFSEALAKISHILLEESRHAIAEEMENIFDPYLLDSKKVFQWVKQNEWMERFKKVYTDGVAISWFKNFSYSDTVQVFGAPFWEDADLYGGNNWARITEAVMKLDAEVRRGNNKDLMFAVDTLLDLEHNTGSLSQKLNRMKVSKETLDLRAGFRSAADFKPYVSPQVAALILPEAQ